MGGSVNQGAVQQQQQNQQQAQQYAAAQQAAAIKAVNDWLSGNKAPSATAAPLTPPNATSPATMGGPAPAAPPPPPPPQQGQAAPPTVAPVMNPQAVLAMQRMMGQQTAGRGAM